MMMGTKITQTLRQCWSRPVISYLPEEVQYSNYTVYEGSLKSSWTHLITPSRNFVEVR
jgi:hypothetical protein